MQSTNWTAVAVDHWTATINGQPVSVKKWLTGWILARRYHRQPCIQFKTLREVKDFLT